jgi:hypothetical protein
LGQLLFEEGATRKPNVTELFGNFEVFFWSKRQFSIQGLRSMRAALSSVFIDLHPNMPTIASHGYFKSFFKAKRSTTVPIPKPEKLETWDLDIIIHHMEQYYEKDEELSIYDLQKKTIVLTCIATIWRPRSDVGRLQLKNITFARDDNEQLTGVTLFVTYPK